MNTRQVLVEALLERYRCPEEFATFAVARELSSQAGYFRFGHNTICYGQSSLGSPAKAVRNGLRDLSEQIDSTSPHLLPFDPCEAIDNLRLERYAANGDKGSRTILSSGFIRKTYYALRPLMDVPVRRHFQRWFLRDWEQLSFPRWPVDRSVEQIFETLLLLSMKARRAESIPFIWFWPEGLSSCVIITHDVETKAGLQRSSELMDIDDAHGVKASFQVIPEKQYAVPKAFLGEIRARGFELNVQDLHHDGNLFDDRDAFLRRARVINQYLREYGAQGFRAGRMYRNVDWLEELDISYDMSVPNVAHLEPQRGGCCTVFPYFIGNILELPLTTTQDYSLLHVLGTYSTELWRKQIGLIAEKNGLASFVIHPDYILAKRAPDVYRSLLGELTARREEGAAWIALPRDVNHWWRQRSQMKLVKQGDTYRIEGPGKERARVAYASFDGDRVTYTVEKDGDPVCACEPGPGQRWSAGLLATQSSRSRSLQ